MKQSTVRALLSAAVSGNSDSLESLRGLGPNDRRKLNRRELAQLRELLGEEEPAPPASPAPQAEEATPAAQPPAGSETSGNGETGEPVAEENPAPEPPPPAAEPKGDGKEKRGGKETPPEPDATAQRRHRRQKRKEGQAAAPAADPGEKQEPTATALPWAGKDTSGLLGWANSSVECAVPEGLAIHTKATLEAELAAYEALVSVAKAAGKEVPKPARWKFQAARTLRDSQGFLPYSGAHVAMWKGGEDFDGNMTFPVLFQTVPTQGEQPLRVPAVNLVRYEIMARSAGPKPEWDGAVAVALPDRVLFGRLPFLYQGKDPQARRRAGQAGEAALLKYASFLGLPAEWFDRSPGWFLQALVGALEKHLK